MLCTLQSGIEEGSNKWGWGWKRFQGECLWGGLVTDSCYRRRWREGYHVHWIKNFSFLKRNLLRLLHIFHHTKNMTIALVHNVIIIGTTISCVFSASCSNYSFHANILYYTTNNHHELLSLDNSGNGWEDVLLAQS